MKIDFDGIQAFVAIAELGGFSKAAEYLHVTQTALTRRLQKLEAYLDVRLLEPRSDALSCRKRRESSATSRASSGDSRTWQAGWRQFHPRRIPTMASRMLPESMRRYALTHPANRIRIIDANGFGVRDSVLNGQAELGIGLQSNHHRDRMETLRLAGPFVFFCRPDHPLSANKTITWSDLREAQLIEINTISAKRISLDFQLAKLGIEVSGSYEVRHRSTAIGLVAAGIGVAILPAATLEEGADHGLCRVPLLRPVIKRKICVITERNGTLSPAASAFFDLLMTQESVVGQS